MTIKERIEKLGANYGVTENGVIYRLDCHGLLSQSEVNECIYLIVMDWRDIMKALDNYGVETSGGGLDYVICAWDCNDIGWRICHNLEAKMVLDLVEGCEKPVIAKDTTIFDMVKAVAEIVKDKNSWATVKKMLDVFFE